MYSPDTCWARHGSPPRSPRSTSGTSSHDTALDRLSLPTDRLRPVYEVAKQGCAQYEKAGTCFATAARLGVVVAGSADEQKQRQAEDCGFAAPGDGSKLFADAEIKGFELSEAVR